MTANKYVRGASILALAGVAIAVAMIVVRSRAPVEAPPGEILATEPGFVDVTQESGVRFRMQFLPNEQGERFKINVYDHGTGIAVGDYNGDGLDDLYFLNQLGKNALYRNAGGGKFVDATEEAGKLGLGDRVSVGGTFSDYDNDGDQDLYVTSIRGGNVLFQNQGNGTFEDVTADAGLTCIAHSQTAAFFDADDDADLDLLLTNTAAWTTDEFDEIDSYYIGLGNFDQLARCPVEYNVFYRNNGDGTFADATEAAGLKGRGWGGDIAVADFDQDGDRDVYVTSMFFPDQLYLNDGRGKFADATKDALGKTSWGSIGAKTLDYNNDGLLDLLVVDMHSDMWLFGPLGRDQVVESRKFDKVFGPVADQGEQGRRQEADLVELLHLNYEDVHFGNTLFKNLGGGKFEEVSAAANVETFWPWGVAVGDFDNDGDQDAFIPSGMGYPYFYWPSRLLMNGGEGAFVERSAELGVEPPLRGRENEEKIGGKATPRSSRCAVTLDIDGDGGLDLVVGNFNDAPYVYKNAFPKRHYVAFKLTGHRSNRDAIGAVVKLHVGQRVMVRQVEAAGGYLSHSSKTLHFGLGEATAIERCEILWPSGERQTLANPAIDKLHEIAEPNSTDAGGNAK